MNKLLMNFEYKENQKVKYLKLVCLALKPY
jgi:hypothetical protein